MHIDDLKSLIATALRDPNAKRAKKSPRREEMCLTLLNETLLKGDNWLAEKVWKEKSYELTPHRAHRAEIHIEDESFQRNIRWIIRRFEVYFEGKAASPESPRLKIVSRPTIASGSNSSTEYRFETEPPIGLILGNLPPDFAIATTDTAREQLIGNMLRVPVLPWHQDTSPPGALLRADIDNPVPFHGREKEISDLEEWCRFDSAIAVRLYTGAGGMGKTRLMVELCKTQRSKGWTSGFLQFVPVNQSNEGWRTLIGRLRPLLVVIDYAETRREELRSVIAGILENGVGPVRLVLLARAADDWWTLLKGERDGVGELLSGPASRWHTIAPLAMTSELRWESYSLAANHFARVLKVRAPTQEPDDIEASHFERVLLLHMAALASVEGVQVKGEDGILDYVLRRERRFWTTNAEARGIPAMLHDAVGQAMAVLTLGGGTTLKKEAQKVLKKVPLLKGQPAATIHAISQLLHETYPGNKWIEPLMPDLLGEHLVQVELERDTDELLSLVLGARST